MLLFVPLYLWSPKHRSSKLKISTKAKRGHLQYFSVVGKQISSTARISEIAEELSIYIISKSLSSSKITLVLDLFIFN